MDVTVVVPCHDAAATLGRQLEALAAQEVDGALEVLVVDNRSTDGSADVAAAYVGRVPGLRVVPATTGRGVSYARNAGTREASAPLVLYCDADDEVRPGWVRAMTAALAGHEIVGGRLDTARLNAAGPRSWTEQPDPAALPTAMRYRPYATGACLGLRVSSWEQLGGFDETMVGGHEEVDLAWRAQDLGMSVGFAPAAVVDYRLRPDVRGTMRQRFAYGRTYAHLYARFRSHPIRRTSARHEVRAFAAFLATLPAEARAGMLPRWLAEVAWTLGRWRGGLERRVRPPL